MWNVKLKITTTKKMKNSPKKIKEKPLKLKNEK